MSQFEKHTETWFVNRIGQLVERTPSVFTPQKVYGTLLQRNIVIADKNHAKACYVCHKDYKVNFKEVNS